MFMRKDILYKKVEAALKGRKGEINFDLDLILYLLEKTIFNDPRKNCILKTGKNSWRGLPESKSLFFARQNCGLPIGNLTSQLFGNVYLNDFDHFVKRDLKIKYYGRYVDDFVMVAKDKSCLKEAIPEIKKYLNDKLKLTLHPHKMYLQHFSKGVKYLGAVIKPYRIYIANRTKGNFYRALEAQNRIVSDHKPTDDEKNRFISIMNSYLGIMKHCKTYKIRKQMIENRLSPNWRKWIPVKGDYAVFSSGGG